MELVDLLFGTDGRVDDLTDEPDQQPKLAEPGRIEPLLRASGSVTVHLVRGIGQGVHFCDERTDLEDHPTTVIGGIGTVIEVFNVMVDPTSIVNEEPMLSHHDSVVADCLINQIDRVRGVLVNLPVQDRSAPDVLISRSIVEVGTDHLVRLKVIPV